MYTINFQNTAVNVSELFTKESAVCRRVILKLYLYMTGGRTNYDAQWNNVFHCQDISVPGAPREHERPGHAEVGQPRLPFWEGT